MKPHREEYITCIFKLNAREGGASNKTISQWLEVAPSSVTEMLRKLEADGLVLNEQGMISLTEEGKEQAEKILSKHRLWELFLQQVLNYDWHDVHEQARLLQYATSDRLMEKLNAFLNYPAHCPHGGLIFLNDHGAERELILLSRVKPGHDYVIQRISDDKELLDYFLRKGLALGDEIHLVDIDSFDGTAHLRKDKEDIFLSAKACADIFVYAV